MSDLAEMDLFQESWTLPRKKKKKKDKKSLKQKNGIITTETGGDLQRKKKKKKNSKFKEAMEARKDKKKDKKKKKKQVDEPAMKHNTLKPHSNNDELETKRSIQDSQKKTKTKKKVAFDLSPGLIPIKRPKFAFSTPSVPPESEAVGDEEIQLQVTGTEQETGNNDSQCNSEDINSQDLFITQKTFRASPPEPSSSENSDKTPNSTPQRDKRAKGSYNGLKDSLKQLRRTTHPVLKPVKVELNLTEDEDDTQPDTKQGKSNVNMKKLPLPVQTKRVKNPYLDDPDFLNPSLVDAKPERHSNPPPSPPLPHCKHDGPPPTMKTSSSTQTENFFTDRHCSFLSFCLERRADVDSEDLKPLDLRVRKDAASSSSPGGNQEDNNMHETSSSDPKEVESADMTTSSEDNETHCHPNKLDLTQVRVVQMRLNESFFFKTKGEGQSPRATSPLMKLVQGRVTRSRKRL